MSGTGWTGEFSDWRTAKKKKGEGPTRRAREGTLGHLYHGAVPGWLPDDQPPGA